MVEYLDPSIAGEGLHADAPIPGWMGAPDAAAEEWQPDIDPPHVNDYGAFKKHKHYRQYFRPYRYVPFPAWMYHATLGEKIVKTAAEAVALGAEWSRTPLKPRMDMTGKSLPVKNDVQRLAEAVAAGLTSNNRQGPSGVDGATINTIVAAVMAALAQANQKPAEPDPESLMPSAAGDDIERKALLELAEKEGVKIDKRWSVARMKEALGL